MAWWKINHGGSVQKSSPKRKTPLKRNTEHNWEWEITGGIKHRICSRCNRLWVTGEPPVSGCPGMKRSKIKPSNPKRKARMRSDEDGFVHTYGYYHVWITTMPCLVENRMLEDGVDAHHLKHVGNGGRDYRNQIPLINRYHIEVETIGEAKFCKKYDLPPLQIIADRCGDVWDKRHGEGPRNTAVDDRVEAALRRREGRAGD